MTSSIITVSNVSKAYRIGKKSDRADSFVGMLQEAVLAPFRNWKKMQAVDREESDEQDEVHWALRDVSFEVKEGDVVGIIGRNGAGKSTLLKILSRITEPTAGEVRIRGRVASLLEVGTGFHPELSGRENVYLNGTILGMNKYEIDRKFDEIVEFSGIGKFLDTPIKRYSSGMKVRLAFAVAAHLEPEILVVDEVLAVGDAEFQKKCIGKMRDVSKGGRTVLFVSHNISAVQTLCKSGVLLSCGKLLSHGGIENILDLYSTCDSQTRTSTWQHQPVDVTSEDSRITRIDVELEGEQPSIQLSVDVVVQSGIQQSSLIVAVDIHSSQGEWIMQAIPQLEAVSISPGCQSFLNIKIELPPMIPGVYPVSVWIGRSLSQSVDWVKEMVHFEIQESPTQGRTVPHMRERGYVVPVSSLTINERCSR